MIARLVPLLLALALLGGCRHAGAMSPAAVYYGQSLLAQSGGNTIELWLDPDGRYIALFHLAGGAAEGRTGTFSAVANPPAGTTLCLRADNDLPPRTLLFHEDGCVVLPVHPIGEIFSLTQGGEAYRMVLAEGR